MQAIQLINRALKLAGITAAREEPAGEDVSQGLECLNSILDIWSSNPGTLPNTENITINLQAGQSEYFYSPMIVDIINGNVVSIDNFKTILKIANNQLQNSFDYETSNGRPFYVYLDSDYNFIDLNTQQPTSKLQFFPTPDANYTVNLLVSTILLNVKFYDEVKLPPFSRAALEYELAIRLCEAYGKEPEPSLQRTYNRVMLDFKKAVKLDLSVSLNNNPFAFSSRYFPRRGYYG